MVHCYLNCDRIGKLKIAFNSPILPLTKLAPKWMRKGLFESETKTFLVSRSKSDGSLWFF